MDPSPRVHFADETLARSAAAWYAVRVKSRFEFVTANALGEKGYECLLPVYRSTRRWSDRIKKLNLPLFPGYLFSCFDAAEPLPVLNSPGVVNIVSAGRKPLAVDEREIASVETICRSAVAAQPWPFLRAGKRVVVACGPLAGAEGVVIEASRTWRLVVSITMLQRSVSVELEPEWLRPVS